MSQINEWLQNSIYTNPLSPGCKQCAEGAKLVLLITGMCPARCYYCPLSLHKTGNDVIYADEWKLENEQQTDVILREAHYIEAEGAGITGGDPLIKPDRTKRYISLLKDYFSDQFHIHLYTSGLKGVKQIPALAKAGLDEIRFHPPPHLWNNMHGPVAAAIQSAINEPLDTAIEIPSIPHKEEHMISLIRWADQHGVNWVNLNELEFSESNYQVFNQKGYQNKNEISAAVKGSEETAHNVIHKLAEEKSLSTGLHYCSSSFKDAIQLKNRITRRAQNTAKPYMIITDEGTLLKGIIHIPQTKDITDLLNRLQQHYQVPRSLYGYDAKNNRVEIALWILEDIAEELTTHGGFPCFMVEEYPTQDQLEVERIPLPL